MKIEKAIEILALRCLTNSVQDMGDYKDALLLGIEALKWINSYRDEHRPWQKIILHGETADAHSP